MGWRICKARLRRGFLAGIFLKANLVVFAGGFAKTGGKTWCFDGQFVVECVVNVVS